MQCFPEVRHALEANGPCSFADCKHIHEPGCVVGRQWDRHAIYAAMMAEAKQAERRQRDRGQGKAQRQAGMRLKSSAEGGTRAEPQLRRQAHRRQSRRRHRMETEDLWLEAADGGTDSAGEEEDEEEK
eukprot:EG_transcript_50486